MDLRKKIRSKEQLQRAKKLALSGLLNYQPFVFSDELVVGAGMSVAGGKGAGQPTEPMKQPPSVYCPTVTPEEASTEYATRQLAKPDMREAFVAANERMRRYYDDLVDRTESALGSLKGLTTLDVGCASGYFPISFAQRGAKRAVGMDRVDYAQTIALLNDICQTQVQFRMRSYDGSIKSDEQFDLVSSIVVLCHLSDPLQHLAWLGSSARKALLVFTACHDDDNYSIKFHSVNRYYEDRFPYCFDFVTVSKKLLRLSMERMGFTKVVEIPVGTTSMPPAWTRLHLGLLGIREGEAGNVGTRHAIAASPAIAATPEKKSLAAKFLGRASKLSRAIMGTTK